MSTMTKAQLCAIVVESSTFYGSRTVKKLNKWWRKNHHEIVGHNEREARKAVRGAVKELNEFKDGRIKELMRLTKADLLTMLKHISSRAMERRYGGNRIKESSLPKIDLGEESRQIEVDKKEIQKWLRQCKRRKRKPVQHRPLVPKKTRRRKIRINDYLANIKRYNKGMSDAVVIAGLEG